MALDVVEVPIDELVPADYNPRAMTKAEAAQLRTSIERFGVVEPLVVNAAPERKNVIIGGHQRWGMLKALGWDTVPVVYVAISDPEKERELNLRLNKNTGHFDNDLLAEFDESLLRDVGFSEQELAKIFDLGDEEDELAPEVPFSEELLEEHNYVVLYFDNAVDWARLLSLYPLPTVRALKTYKSPGTAMRGVGRVVRGTAFLDAILGEDRP